MQLKIFGVGTMVGAAFLITLTSKTWMKPFANKAQAMVRRARTPAQLSVPNLTPPPATECGVRAARCRGEALANSRVMTQMGPP